VLIARIINSFVILPALCGCEFEEKESWSLCIVAELLKKNNPDHFAHKRMQLKRARLATRKIGCFTHVAVKKEKQHQ